MSVTCLIIWNIIDSCANYKLAANYREPRKIELTVQRSEVVINAPIIVWNGLDGEPKILPNIDTIFQSIPDFSGEVVYVNTSSFKYHLILNTLV
jgi:hypothetical protein